jgi:ribonuclease HI
MEGLDAFQGVDRRASMALHDKSVPFDAGILRGVLSGSLRMQQRLFVAKLVDSPLCPFCGMTDETVEHCFWECPHWSHIRDECDVPDAGVVAAWPACTRQCGLFIDDVRVPDLTAALQEEELVLRDFVSHFDLLSCRQEIEFSGMGTPQILWTDGACSHNQDDRFRRAGSGIFYGASQAMNWQGMLPGLLQSNQRAELFAVLVACIRDPRPLDIRSDSKYVCDGVDSCQGWMQHGWSGQHADLWDLLADQLNTRMHPVSVSWVLGHAKRIDVLRGRTTWADKLGNDGADELAVAGAATHAIPADIIESAQSRLRVAMSVHTMMLDITRARQSARPAECDRDADRGSDLGDVSESDVCDSDNEDMCTASDTEELHPLACLYK